MRGLVAFVTVVSLLTPFASARGAAGCGVVSGNFTTISGPRFSAGPQRITDLAIDPRSPSRFFVTNGTSVMRTADGGCSWQSVYALGPQPAEGQTYTASNARIVTVVVPEAGGRVLLLIAETIVNQTRPHVLVSSNAGHSWESGDAGLPPLGSPEALVVASSSPDIAYLAVDLGGGTIDSIFASSDGGRSWEPRAQHLGGEFDGLEVDPIAPNELWAYGNGLHHSTDGGATWIPVDDLVGVRTGPMDVWHAPGNPSDVFVFVPAVRAVKRSQDGGKNWLDAYGLAAPTSVAHGAIADSRVATSDGKMFVWVPALFSWIDARAPAGGLTDLQATRSDSTRFFMHNGSQVVVYGGQTGRDYDVERPEFVIGDITVTGDPPDFISQPPTLNPKKEVIRIPAGEKKRVTYDLSLSKTRTPLDLYFLLDTSESALPFLKGLAHELGDLISKMYAARLDVHFGLGEYRAYPDSTPPRPDCDDDDVPVVEDPQCERNFVYRRVVDLAEDPSRLESAIEGLEAVAGGHYDASLPALYQTATGAGEDLWPYGGTTDSSVDGHDVPPGQQANFRAKALRVVLIATDEAYVNEPYPRDDFPPDPPTKAEVIRALNDRAGGRGGIRQIGLALGTDALEDMQDVATGTGAVAPAGGADCDGDGVAEIGRGDPLVCTVQRGTLEQGSNLVPAIVSMVEAVRDSAPVSLKADPKDDVVASVSPEEYPGVVLQADQDLKFTVTYECPTSMAGKRSPVALSALQGSRKLATATATVVCGDVAKKKDEFFDLYPFDRVLGLLPLLPLSPPPTLTNPSQATQAQSQAQAQGAMATQEQEQPQVAVATQYNQALKEALARDEEYAMTRYRERSRPELPPGVFVAAVSLMMAGAYGVAASRRRRFGLAYQRRR